ncbi:MAG: hypothetical protein ABIK43_02780 [candidate division WOR-3 bacterium]
MLTVIRQARTRAGFFCSLALAITAASCDRTAPSEFRAELNVQVMLRQGLHDRVEMPVFVNRTYSIFEEPQHSLAGAEVLIWSRQWPDTLRFAEQTISGTTAYYCTTMAMIPVTGGETCWLQVIHPDFDTVRARTIAPDTFRILYPATGDTVSDGDSLVFRRSRNAKGYLISYDYRLDGDTWRGWIAFPNESIPGLPYDTAVMRLPMVWLRTVEPGRPYQLVVAALDSNYFEWAGGRAQNPRRDRQVLSAGISGGVGVFGSICEQACTVYVRQDSAGRRCLRQIDSGYFPLKRSNR